MKYFIKKTQRAGRLLTKKQRDYINEFIIRGALDFDSPEELMANTKTDNKLDATKKLIQNVTTASDTELVDLLVLGRGIDLQELLSGNIKTELRNYLGWSRAA